jgi:23S rRNA (guanosine2251-2'-O)-methyltransferase
MKSMKNQPVGELIYGIRPILELIKAKKRKIISIYTTRPEPKVWRELEPLLPERVQIQYVAPEVLDRMVGTTDHQRVIAWVGQPVVRKKFFDPEKHKFLLMLDGIQDARNLGAILRSAYCIGIDGIIITKRASAPLNATAIKASAGLAEHLEILVVSSAQEAAKQLQEAGYTIYLATLDGADATKQEYNYPLCLVIGSEGSGISHQILNSGTHITLPQRTADISYNASVAAGILLFLIAQRR